MIISKSTTASLLASFLLALPQVNAQAQFVVDNLSFGHKRELSSSTRSIPGWQIRGEAYTPEIVEDRIILTPQGQGNRRGGLWGENSLEAVEWTADVEFRVTGEDHGSGMLQIWLTKEKPANFMSSIYNAGQFEGLVLVLNQYAGSGGTLRGFLNDGSTSYREHRSVDSLAFSHCDYAYRNLGRFSNMKIRQTPYYFEVALDGLTCFKSENVMLPAGYHFGISASSQEHPDSFEIHKFLVSTPQADSADRQLPPQQQPNQQYNPPPQQQQQQYQQPVGGGADPQVVDMLNRLQATTSNIDNIWQELKNVDAKIEQRQNELRDALRSTQDQISGMLRKIEQIDGTAQRIQRDIEGRDYQQTLASLQQAVKDTQSNLLSSLPQSMSQIVSTSAPKMGFFIFVVLAFQAVLAGCYVIYKRRRANSPKKLL